MFFKLPWFGKTSKARYHDTQVLELDFLVDEFYEAMADIEDPVRQRMQGVLASSQTPRDLWFMRGKLFALISKHHCESVATTRLARLDQKLRYFMSNHPAHSADELPTGPMGLMH